MRQRLAFVAVKQNDVAGRSLLFEKVEAQHRSGQLRERLGRPFSVCRGRRQRNFFFAGPWRVANG